MLVCTLTLIPAHSAPFLCACCFFPVCRRTVYDAVNDVSIVLSNDELHMLERLRKGEYAHAGFDPYADYDGDAFTNQVRHEPLGNVVEPKRRFLPSKNEAKVILKYVTAMRNGWMKMPSEEEKEREEKAKASEVFLLWGDGGQVLKDATMHTPHRMPAKIAAPKQPLPTHSESYNPPPEYIPTQEEKDAWERMDASDRPHNYVPSRFNALREVPAYQNLIKERFERCLDLYLCPRAKVKKVSD